MFTTRILAKSLSGELSKLIALINLLFLSFAKPLISEGDKEKKATSEPDIIADKTSKEKSNPPCRTILKKSKVTVWFIKNITILGSGKSISNYKKIKTANLLLQNLLFQQGNCQRFGFQEPYLEELYLYPQLQKYTSLLRPYLHKIY